MTPPPTSGDPIVLPEGEIHAITPISASSPCGLRTVYISLRYPDGTTDRMPLAKKSPSESESLWWGLQSFRVPLEGGPPFTVSRTATAVDCADRSMTIALPPVIVSPRAGSKSDVALRARVLSPLVLEMYRAFEASPNVDFPSADAYGGPYPVYVLLDFAAGERSYNDGLTDYWMEVTGADGRTERFGLDRWGRFNGMNFGQILLPPNETKHAVAWTIVFAIRRSDVEYRSAPTFFGNFRSRSRFFRHAHFTRSG